MSNPPEALAPRFIRLLYNHNPFYLIGTLLVLFGMQQSLGREPSLATSGLLVALLGGYTLLLVGVAAVVIRWGQVWDDARTILLVIVLLFFMLSTSLDFHLLFTLEAPWPGSLLLAGGLLFSVVLSEGVLRGLRIGLPLVYRGPYYLVLVLLFAYPVGLGWMNYYSYYEAVTWALFAFPAASAVALLTLLPAASTPAWREPKTGTPWPWPYYPWSLFVYLTIGLAIRAWWLTIAFEPAKGTDAYFRPYFLLPLVLAWAILILEMGLVRRATGAIAAALMLPLVGLVIGFSGSGHNAVEVAFLDRLVQAVGSPPQLTVAGLLLVYGYAWIRGVRAAEGFVLAAGLLASIVNPQTLDWSSLSSPNPLVVSVVAGILFGLAMQRQSSWRALAGGALVAAGLCVAEAKYGGDMLRFWQWHAPPLALFAIVAAFDDDLAKGLRELAWRVAPGLALIAALAYPWSMPGLSPKILAIYLALLFFASLLFWLRERQVELLGAMLATLAANLLAHARQLYVLLEQTALAGGLPWLSAGLLVVAFAFAISLLKMGLWVQAWRWLARVNLALGGSSGTL